MRAPRPLPRTQDEIVVWLEGPLSKQYDTEQTALRAVEEYRDAVMAALEEAAQQADKGEAHGIKQNLQHLTAASRAESRALRAFARKLGGAA